MESSKKAFFTFSIFSILGFILFLVPIKIGGKSKIFISHFSYMIKNNIYTPFIILTQIIAFTVLILSIIFLFYNSKNEYLNKLFKSTPINIITRVLGSLLYIIILNEWFAGNVIFDTLMDKNIGGVMVGPYGLLSTLYITFFIGILILPFITHFGAVEYIGTLCAPIVEKIFKVPGYSAVDAIASFVGDGTIGIVVTDTQYKRGYYSKREAYIIATSFSIVGIAFAASVAQELGFESIFPIFYLTIVISVIIIAIITARLPLKKFPHEYYEGQEPKKFEKPKDMSTHSYALELACKQADKTQFTQILKESLNSILNIYIGFLPTIMLVGTLALVIAEKTPFFNYISYPLVPIYDLLGFSNDVAKLLAPATVIGFADMYLPALFIHGSPSEASRFFIGVLAFTQLIFMSETGMILLKSSIGLNFLDVIKVFVYRTIFSIPIVLGLTYILSLLNIIVW